MENETAPMETPETPEVNAAPVEPAVETTPTEAAPVEETTPAEAAPKQSTIADAPKLTTDELIFGVASYFTVAVLATIFTKPNSEFCTFHARQGVALIILDLVFLVVMTVMAAIVPFLGYALFFIGILALFALHILGLANAIQGKKYKIPVVYGISKKIDLNKFLSKPSATPTTPVQPAEPTATTEVAEPTPAPAEPVAPVTPPAAPTTPPPTNNPLQNNGQDMVDRAVENMKGDQPQ